MKCPKCGGNAELSNWGSYVDPDFADFHVECEKCGYHSMGSTDQQKAKEMFEKEMGAYYTNEQWFCLLSTEEKAKFIFWQHFDVYGKTLYELMVNASKGVSRDKQAEVMIGAVVEWLKKPHDNILKP